MAVNNNHFSKNNQVKTGELKRLINSLTITQKISIVLIILVVIVSVFLLIKWSSRPEQSVLYSGLQPEEASSVIEKLDNAKIAYELSEDGTIIRVKSSELANARLTLAGEGIPYNSIVGFELFDQQFFGLTDFTQQVNYQRALEGELSRTISEISEIESARVHLVMSEEDLFTEESTAASASIIVKLAGGTALRSESIKAIGNLISNAVKGLELDNISIIDTSGNLLTAGGGEDAQVTERQKMAREVESGIENSITGMLTRIFGAGNVVVNVKADLNFDKRQSETETYLPGEDGNGVVLSSVTLKENYNRDIQEPDTGGMAGTDSNVPQFEIEGEEGEEENPVYAEVTEDGETGSNYYNKEENQVEYGVSRKIEKIEYNAGEIDKLNIGIFLDASISGEEMEDIKSVVASAAGIDTGRGDSISIELMDFIETEEGFAVEPVIEPSIWQKILSFGGKAWPGILLIIMLLMLTLRAGKKSGGFGFGMKNGLRRVNTLPQGRLPLSGKGGGMNIYKNEVPSARDAENTGSSGGLPDLLSEGESLSDFFRLKDSELTVEQKREKLAEIRKRVLDKKNKDIYPELKELVAIEAGNNPDIAMRVIENWLSEKY